MTPVMMYCQSGLNFIAVMPTRSMEMMKIPIRLPAMEAVPPAMEVPPMTHAAMALLLNTSP